MKRIAEMTHQEMFDTAYRGLAAQGFERSKTGTICAYRGAVEGRKCAVGHLLTDDEVHTLGAATPADGRIFADRLGLDLSMSDFHVLRGLMSAHDNARSPEQMRLLLSAVATTFGLKVPEVTP